VGVTGSAKTGAPTKCGAAVAARSTMSSVFVASGPVTVMTSESTSTEPGVAPVSALVRMICVAAAVTELANTPIGGGNAATIEPFGRLATVCVLVALRVTVTT
jgi:hypothetical protein